MLWGFKIVFAFLLVGLATAQGPSPLCGTTNPDGKTFYENMIDNTFPKTLADYNAVISAFPDSNATPEDVDSVYHATEGFYRIWLDTFVYSLWYVETEIFRDCTTAPAALATVYNSTRKVEALLPQLQRIMTGLSRFEPQILAQGRPGHSAIYQPLDNLAYNLWHTTTDLIHQRISGGKPTPYEDAVRKYYDAVEAVRVQYYREEDRQQPRP
ncbi:hypothetical protein EST38_g9783 [Candolleomyces aberdarensis]|uniref:Uncharacterized protein n=1 Tax=Candolleomyces aberdarensis TaxID=2316362 RepID=A0A4Q2DBY6_9AGAR|nr:hypothetical protein EST38_g9783 [Candolleomyces aberdarensis]